MRVPAATILPLAVAVGLACAPPASGQTAAQAPNELDAFMARVLERRDDNWKKLHEYVLDERETFEILGPGNLPLRRHSREYTWYVRDGYLVRSPVRYNGVVIPEETRRTYEARWLEEERERETREAEGKSKRRRSISVDLGGEVRVESEPSPAALAGFEPRFVSEAYFLEFPIEQGNYYLAGREPFEGQEVVKVEYYPRRLFNDDEEPEEEREEDILRKMNKTSLVTIWIDPADHQIVKYAFDNIGMEFLPARWLVRVDDLQASMTMGQPFPGVWLPRGITFEGGITIAIGSFTIRYRREYLEYRKAEVKARIRHRTPDGSPR